MNINKDAVIRISTKTWYPLLKYYVYSIARISCTVASLLLTLEFRYFPERHSLKITVLNMLWAGSVQCLQEIRTFLLSSSFSGCAGRKKSVAMGENTSWKWQNPTNRCCFPREPINIFQHTNALGAF